MINTNKNTTYLILTNIFFIHSFSQISTNELPLSILDSTLRLNELEELNSKIIYETFDSLIGDNNQILINQFGNSIETNVNIENSGIWRNLESGGRIWSLIIECTQAKSINLIFDKYWLPKGAKLFIYNPETKYSIGAFTEENNLGTYSSPSGFATRLLPNNKIYIELFEPENIVESSIISISNINYGVKCSPLISDLGCYGESGECHVNIIRS